MEKKVIYYSDVEKIFKHLEDQMFDKSLMGESSFFLYDLIKGYVLLKLRGDNIE